MSKIINKPDFTASIVSDAGSIYLESIIFKTNKAVDLNDYEEFREVDKITGHMVMAYPYLNDQIEKLVLPRGVNEVGLGAFHGAKISTVVWPDACEYIPEQAFMSSTIKHICNISHVKTIGGSAFRSCCIDSIDIPDGITIIPKNCFLSSCIKSVSGCRNVEIIEPLAFSGCCSLKSFTIPDKVTIIPRMCFYMCRRLKDVSGLEHIKIFEEEAFAGCEAIEDISSLAQAFSINTRAFSLTSIENLNLSDSVCVHIGSEAFADTNIKHFTPGYFLKEVYPRAFAGTPYERNLSR